MVINHTPALMTDTSRKHLSQLTFIRSILLVALWASLGLAVKFEQINLSSTYLVWVLMALSVIHLLTLIRLTNTLRVTQVEFFVQLLIDVISLSALFYLSGGANNPFISYLLIPICIAATTLPWRYTWLITSLCLINYTLLLFFYVRFPIFEMGQQHQHHENTNWHIIGMWFNFSLSAILITYFVVKMARALQENTKILSSMREDELRNQQLMAVAMLAAGAAHEMNTPLSTMTILLSELQDEHQQNSSLIADLDILNQQVKHCAKTLKELVQDSSEANQGKFKQQEIKAFCDSIINRWQLMRPNVNFYFDIKDINNETITQDPRLDQAIINLLNNAADASPENIAINVYCNNNQLIWKIIDSGKGISDQLESKLGKMMLSTKDQGLGIGLLLAHATIKHYGGNLSQTPNKPSGTITELRLPLTP